MLEDRTLLAGPVEYTHDATFAVDGHNQFGEGEALVFDEHVFLGDSFDTGRRTVGGFVNTAGLRTGIEAAFRLHGRSGGLNQASLNVTEPLAGPAGYQVFVRAQNSAGTSGWSPASTFDLVIQSGLIPPALVGPVGTVDDPTPVISWPAVAAADSYELLMYNTGTGQEVLFARGLGDPSHTPADPLPDSAYQIFVRSAAGGNVSLWGLPLTFTISGGGFHLPPRPAFTAPAGTTGDSTPTIAWTAGEPGDRYELHLYSIDRGQQIL